MTLVVRREGDELVRYVHVGTGNYHSKTARLYEDFGLFTADPDIAADVADLFNYLTGYGRPKRLPEAARRAVRPARAPDRADPLVRDGCRRRRARRGSGSRSTRSPIRSVIEALYAASASGASIDLVVRSICSLRPGVEGLSENIRVRSVLGRFLEHSRVFMFEHGDERVMLLGSADLMPRNLDHRVEILAPIADGRLQAEIERVFQTLLADNTHRMGAARRRRVAASKAEEGRAAARARRTR